MNLRDRIPLRDEDRAPHRSEDKEGCISIVIAAAFILA